MRGVDHAPRPRPLVIAHRGASGYRPEHSAAAVRLGFAQGADAVEPDLVASSDGVLVIRHENELSGTTDVADRPEFADRRATRVVDGVERTGWFTEDMTWAEIRTLRCRERIPAARPDSATHDDQETVLSLPDLLRIIDQESARHGRPLGMVAEIKHATHFAALGMPLDELLARDLREHGWGDDASRLTIESFERTALLAVRARGVAARLVYLLEGCGAAIDEVARHGDSAITFDEQLTDAGLAALAAEVDGISVGLERICPVAGFGSGSGAGSGAGSGSGSDGGAAPVSDLVRRAHDAGLSVFTWTLRPENAFLPRPLRGPGPKSAHGDFRTHWGRLLDAGVDGVFADHPDLAVRLVEERVAAVGR
ncbi:glycerophosphodiester phosphodiesterase family protein [Clavibacter nebraskensis]|uniref:glycerophosphodiester phosphodiesterase n=2 Tax=Clavibacter nebraskensis TaxID=31963 RepID=A0AAI8ZJE1_9MICO|nr:glycerophosphodiester phosphodiesterase family protein [Clavibacter nebraskensis]QGV67575.1 glycerophosphodiester phosphodiesterase [Clavibacter nebraskensis]RIJ14600.1 glycerophosphodiester phosphodiesterase [Clavibacter nebraskensis]UKF28828.1 glycerophosphodiester phosphodiesterase [Clavibacter nebraskensis]UQB07469.1 glycerophosphodiester phosphodiesterase [Clavibacter nebraskensis]UQB13137.1 glycerophosphodiester phosphodiesterase [Clavibacter nebraskensis]